MSRISDYRTLIKDNIDDVRSFLNNKNLRDLNVNEERRLLRYLKREQDEQDDNLDLIYNNSRIENQLYEMYRLLPDDFKKELNERSKKDRLIVYNYIRTHSYKIFKNYPFTYGDKTKYYAENKNGDRLYLLKFLGVSVNQNVYLSYLIKSDERLPTNNFLNDCLSDLSNSRIYVIKWDVDRHSIYEINIWRKYLEQNLPDPKIKTNFKFLGYNSIVMKLLSKIKIENKNTYVILGCQILDILRKIHRFGCHSDIKPDNIMCEKINGKTIYYLIDMGGVSIRKEGNGYHRRAWSTRYTSQNDKQSNVITYKHDLIELGYTLNIVYSKCNNISINSNEYRYLIPNSPVWKYMEYVENLSKKNRNEKIYEDLKNILKKNAFKL